MKVSVMGLGYVGASLMYALANSGISVVGYDKSQNRINELKENGDFELGITQQSIENFLIAGRINLTSKSEFIRGSDVIVIAVPTPLSEDRTPDLSMLEQACETIELMMTDKFLLINESTSFPGTLRNVIAKKITKTNLFASAPERIDPSSSTWTLKNTPRIIGGINSESAKQATIFYKKICDNVYTVSNPEVAEAAKLLENTFRQINISLINEFSQISEKFGITASEVIDAASTKPFGFTPFYPGLGAGGHCIPVDPSYLHFAAKELGVNAEFIDLANRVNSEMPSYVVDRLNRELGELKGKKIQIVGISYKPNVSDVRESPAIRFIELLRSQGAIVHWHDSLVFEWNNENSTPLLTDIDLGVIISPHKDVDLRIWQDSNVKVIDLSPNNSNFGWTKYL